MFNCNNCGGENRPNAQFCRFCGQALVRPSDTELSGEGLEADLDESTAARTELELVPEDSGVTSAVEEGSTTAFAGSEDVQESLPDSEAEPFDAAEQIVEAPALNDEAGESSPVSPSLPSGQVQEADERTGAEENLQPEARSDTLHVLPEGTLLAGRYRIVSAESQVDGGLSYVVEDLARCWNCEAEQENGDSLYCGTCGAELIDKPRMALHVIPEGQEVETSAQVFTEAGVTYQLIWPVREAQSALVVDIVHLVAGYRTDPGQEREINEDSLLALQMTGVCETRSTPVLGFFAVADGIGGSEAGEAASKAAVHSLASEIMENIYMPWVNRSPLNVEECAQRLCEAVRAANQAILDLRSKSPRVASMGCTLTGVLVWGLKAAVVNVGDSRTYLMRGSKLTQITRDHSVVARLVEQGVISPEEIYTHNQKSVIYRSLGDRAALEVDSFILELEPGDRLLLCSDGLWEMVRDPLIEEVLLERHDPQQACDRLVEMANLSGGEDNISVVVVRVDTPI